MDDEKRFDKIDIKLNKIDDSLSSIDVTLAKQQVILDEHVKRTSQLEDRMEPLETFHSGLRGIVATLKVLAIVAGILEVLHIFRIL